MVGAEQEYVLPRLHGRFDAAGLVAAARDGIPTGRDDGAVEMCHGGGSMLEGKGRGRVASAPRSHSAAVRQLRDGVAVDVVRASVLLRVFVSLEACGNPVPEVSASLTAIAPRCASVVLAVGHDHHADDRGGTAAAIAGFHGAIVGLGLALPLDVERGGGGRRGHEQRERLGGRGGFGRGTIPLKHGKLSRPELAFRPVPPDTQRARLEGRGGGVVPMRGY